MLFTELFPRYRLNDRSIQVIICAGLLICFPLVLWAQNPAGGTSRAESYFAPGKSVSEPLSRAEAIEAISKLLLDIQDNREALSDFMVSSLNRDDIEFLKELVNRYPVRLKTLNQHDIMLRNQLEIIQRNLEARFEEVQRAEANRIKLSGDIRVILENINHKIDEEGNDFQAEERIRLSTRVPLVDKTSAFLRIEQKYLWGNKAAGYATSVFDPKESHTHTDPSMSDRFNDQNINFKEAYINVRNLTPFIENIRIGRQFVKFGHGLFFSEDLDGLKFDIDMKNVDVGVYGFDTDNIFDGRYNYYQYDTEGNRDYGDVSDQSETDGLNFLGFKLNYAITDRHFLEVYRVKERISKYSKSKAYEKIAGIQIDDPTAPTTYSPVWTGFSLDGKIGEKTDYNLEYVHMNSNIENIINTYVEYGLWDPAKWQFDYSSAAWLAAFQFRISNKNKILLQYGVGDEEFLAYGIDYDYRLNDMRGNWNPGAEPFCSFSGVKDFLCRYSHQFTDRIGSHVQYEKVTHKDTSNVVDNAEDYALYTIGTTIDYGRNHLYISFEHLHYDDPAVNAKSEIDVLEDIEGGVRSSYHTYGGGRNMFKVAYTMEF